MKTLIFVVALAAFVGAFPLEEDQYKYDDFMTELSIFDKIGDAIHHAADKISNDVKHAAEKVKNDVQKVGENIKNGAENVGHKIEKEAKKVGDDIKHAADTVREGVKNAADKAKNGAQKVGQKIKDEAGHVGHEIEKGKKKVEKEVKKGFEKVKNLIRKLKEIVEKTIKFRCENTTCSVCANFGENKKVCFEGNLNMGNLSVEADVKFNDKVILDTSLEVKNPEDLCIGVPKFPILKMCAQAYDVSTDNKTLNGCLRFNFVAAGETVTSVNVTCVHVKL